MHVENYLDTYMLDSASTYRRVKLWSKYTKKGLDVDEVEKTFVARIKGELDEARTLEAANTLIDLKNSFSLQPIPKQSVLGFSQAERRTLLLNKSMLTSGRLKGHSNEHLPHLDLFVNNPNAIAAFIPAFKTSISPIVYEGRPLTIGSTDSCTFNLKSLPFDCSNMCDKQLKIHQKVCFELLEALTLPLTASCALFELWVELSWLYSCKRHFSNGKGL